MKKNGDLKGGSMRRGGNKMVPPAAGSHTRMLPVLTCGRMTRSGWLSNRKGLRGV